MVNAARLIGPSIAGILVAGALGKALGAPMALVISGSTCLAGSLLFARKLPDLRLLVKPIYERLGIIPQVARGVQNASDTPAKEIGG
jgi:hypothetical protein